MLRAVLAITLVALCACSSDATDSSEDDVKVVIDSPLAAKQLKANIDFAKSYKARCRTNGSNPRVLVTGFGRFMSNQKNATGLIVSKLLPKLTYPMTTPPAAGAIDPPGPQLAVALGTITLPKSGNVDVCAIVLPVFWDLAAVLALLEIDAFEPDLVVMNGIAGARQPLWLELGAINKADHAADGSGVLSAADGPVISGASSKEYGRANLLSWLPVREAMRSAIAAHAADDQGGTRFDAIVEGALLAAFPRASNTYLCNNTTYAVGYVMDHPKKTVTLLQPTDPRYGSGIRLTSSVDRSWVPRVFVHWPSELDGAHLTAAANVLAAGIDAQLAALWGYDDLPLPTRGDNAIAEMSN